MSLLDLLFESLVSSNCNTFPAADVQRTKQMAAEQRNFKKFSESYVSRVNSSLRKVLRRKV